MNPYGNHNGIFKRTLRASSIPVNGVIARFVRRITLRAKLAFWNASTPHPRSVNRCFTP